MSAARELAGRLAPGLDADLVAGVVRLAAAGWAGPERVREVLAERLDAGAATGAPEIVDGLLRRAGSRRPLPGIDEAEAVARRLLAQRARLLVVGGEGYPAALADAWPELGAPLWVFVRGVDPLPPGPAVAVVGTRRPTLDGQRSAGEIAAALAARGVTVVSGMARGIDQAAHRAALAAGGMTLAVLGTGFGVDYPSGTGALRNEITARGALLTELVPGTPGRPHHFLQRNRIISGLAQATIVVEGRARSGALQTARLAAAQGRDVWAVPGSLHAPASEGPLALIADGARPVTGIDVLLGDLGVEVSPVRESGVAVEAAAELDGPHGALLALLSAVPASAGELAAHAGTDMAETLRILADLAARGLATPTARGYVAGSG